MSYVSYASALKSLMYGMVCTCPDISDVSVVSRYIVCSRKAHCQTVKWILRYLRGIADVGLVFNKKADLDGCAIRFVDFDYAGDHDKRSLTSYVFNLSSCTVS